MVFLALLHEESEVDFVSVQKLVNSVQQDASAGEVHGLICGLLAAGSKPSESDWNRILENWFDTSASAGDLNRQLVHLATQTLEQLDDMNFSFQLLLPDDEQPMADRLYEISRWCRGFLQGFGLSGNHRQEDLSEDTAELLADFAEISKLSDQTDESDTESDCIEIMEYLKVGTLLIFTEHGHRPNLH